MLQIAACDDSYSVKTINYVLKPISKEKLFFTFDKTLEQITSVPVVQGKTREIKQQYLNYQMEGE